MRNTIPRISMLVAGAALLGAMLAPADAAARRRDRDDHRKHPPRVEVRKRQQRPPVVVREQRHHRPRVVVRDYCPPPAPRWAPPPYRVRVARPWYEGARVVYLDRDPFYFHAGLGVYLGGLAFELEFGDGPPPGYAFYDPYCGEYFHAMVEFRRHLRVHRHAPALRVILLDAGDHCDDW